MINMWLLLPVFYVGFVSGVVLTALMAANARHTDKPPESIE